jgi:adenylate cyclase
MDILFADRDIRNPLDDKKLIEATESAGCVVYMVTSSVVEGNLKWIKPFPELVDAAAELGHVDVEPSVDGIVRQVKLSRNINGETFLAFGLEVVQTYLNKKNGGELYRRNLRIPDNKIYINFTGEVFEQISYCKVLKGNFSSNYFKDKIVLVGCIARGIVDEKSIPLSCILSGVEIHANIVHTILTDNYIISLTMVPLILIILTLGLVTGMIIRGIRVKRDTIIALLLLTGIIVINFLLFSYFKVHLALVPLLLIVILVPMVIIMGRVFWVEKKLNRRVVEFFMGENKRVGMEEQVETITRLTRQSTRLSPP